MPADHIEDKANDSLEKTLKLMDALEAVDERLRSWLMRDDLTAEQKQVFLEARADLNRVESRMLMAKVIDPKDYEKLSRSRLESKKARPRGTLATTRLLVSSSPLVRRFG